MKKIVLATTTLFLSIYLIAQKETDYARWLFLQSDKALQYRIAMVKKEGDFAYFKLQFRVKADDEVHCKDAMCEGYLLYLSHDNIARTETISYNFIFEKSFEGDNNIYTMTELVPVELKTWPDGSKRYFTKEKGIVYTEPSSGDQEYTARVLHVCVDNRLTGQPDNHRCAWESKMKMNKAIVVN